MKIDHFHIPYSTCLNQSIGQPVRGWNILTSDFTIDLSPKFATSVEIPATSVARAICSNDIDQFVSTAIAILMTFPSKKG